MPRPRGRHRAIRISGLVRDLAEYRPAGAGRYRNPIRPPGGRREPDIHLRNPFGSVSRQRRHASRHRPRGPAGDARLRHRDGVVDRSEWNNGGYGNLIEIDHGAGIQTRYGHLSQRIAQAGQMVRRGDLIGLMGSTGRSTGSHLHYEVRVAGQAIDPISFVPGGARLVALRQQRQALAEGGPQPGAR